MQPRYLGDSHDFVKYALLRHVHGATGLRIGLNWYLTRPEDVDRPGNADGEKRHHLKSKEWIAWDADLLTQIRKFENPKERLLTNVSNWQILPSDTQYFDEVVPASGRASWHSRAKTALHETDLVFLDPDTGFEVKSMTKRTAPKYSMYAEAADWCLSGKHVIAIQFARQCDPVKRGQDVRARLHKELGSHSEQPIVRGRLAPNILFITLSPNGQRKTLQEALSSFVERGPKVELIE